MAQAPRLLPVLAALAGLLCGALAALAFAPPTGAALLLAAAPVAPAHPALRLAAPRPLLPLYHTPGHAIRLAAPAAAAAGGVEQGTPTPASRPLSALATLAVFASLAAAVTLWRPAASPPRFAPQPYGAMAMCAAAGAPAEPPMTTAAEGVLFNTLAREWRCKWDSEAGLVACQQVLDKYLAQLKGLDQVEVQRVVCGSCMDFKVVISLPQPAFGDWQAAGFGPEGAVLADLRAVPGVTYVETQTYTLQTLKPPAVPESPMQSVTPNVQFNRIAREWRCKWSDDKDAASLVEAQEVIAELLPLLRSLPGAEVQRVVCGGCKDLKVITSVPAAVFEAWGQRRYKPEENFLNEVTSIRGISQVEVQTYTLMSLTGPTPPGATTMTEKAKGVFFNRVAREWRCKWSKDDDAASLSAAQQVLTKFLPKLKALEGVQVQRVVCGGCLDFKVVTSVPADRYGAWSDANHEPEASFLAELQAIPNITQVETQTYTLQPLDGQVAEGPLQEKAPGILFNRVAREWRCNFSPDKNKASLVAAQKVLDAFLPILLARSGARVQRAVCLDCNQLKVVISVPTSEFGLWKDEEFPPEEEFLQAWEQIPGISNVETQVYTYQTL